MKMTIKIEAISQEDRDYLQEVIPEDPSPDQVLEIAQELLQRLIKDPAAIAQAETIVRRLVNLRREGEIRREAQEAGRAYTFARLHKSSSNMHPVFEQVKVYLRDFAAFCKANGLSEKEMLKVANGEVDSYKEWTQGAVGRALRAKMMERAKPGPAMVLGPFTSAFRTPATGMNAAAAPTFLPAQPWTPAE
jgi:hypothetical protein